MNKVLKVAALGASIVTLATVASAAQLSMNIYGASAQGKFWNTYADTFLKAPVASGGYGCATTTKGYADADSKLGATIGFTCAGNGGDSVIIRYTSNKSVEGPRAVMNLDPQDNDACITGNPTNDNLRKQADWNGTTFVPACLDVHVGASDVASEAFVQETHGQKNGNYTADQYDETLEGQVIPGAAEIGTYANPVIVPFAFFANKTLTGIDNLTRQQALLLMSGNVHSWNQFGTGYPTKGVALCMRHAGSGTHATLDAAIMRGDLPLPNYDIIGAGRTDGVPGIMFHESSSDLMKCVNQNGLYSTDEWAAIGYADADAISASYNADGTENNTKYPNVKRMKFNGGAEGMTATSKAQWNGHSQLKDNIIYGLYEFWASQWMYIKADVESNDTKTLFNKLTAYAANTTLPCPGIGCYWLTQSELQVTKATDYDVPMVK